MAEPGHLLGCVGSGQVPTIGSRLSRPRRRNVAQFSEIATGAKLKPLGKLRPSQAAFHRPGGRQPVAFSHTCLISCVSADSIVDQLSFLQLLAMLTDLGWRSAAARGKAEFQRPHCSWLWSSRLRHGHGPPGTGAEDAADRCWRLFLGLGRAAARPTAVSLLVTGNPKENGQRSSSLHI